jgi:hypothetical protein
MNEPATKLGELTGPDAERCRELRRALGIDASDDAPAFVTGDGAPVDAADVRFRRMASLTAVSLEANGGLCRDLLRTRSSRGPRPTGHSVSSDVPLGTPEGEEVAA